MLKRKYIFIAVFTLFSAAGFSQKDTMSVKDLETDTSFNYDEVFGDFVDFIDSLLAPRSYFLINVTGNNSYFNYKRDGKLEAEKQLVVSPTLGYYHKSGPGITASTNLTDYGEKRKWYQFLISPSFDFIQNRNWMASISYVRYITKDSLPFYTSPLQNEFNGYFIWRKPWLQPGIAVTYGRGSKSDLKEREGYLRSFLRRLGFLIDSSTYVNTTKSIEDFSVVASLRHNFYWINIFGNKDYIRLTPMITFSAGTQRFGFSQTSGVQGSSIRNTVHSLFNSGNVRLSRRSEFQPLSLTFYLRPEYTIGKFFLQPQAIFDYYFPSEDNNFSTFYSINAGFMF